MADETNKDALEKNLPDDSKLDCKRFKSTISSKPNEKGFSVDDEGFYEVSLIS